MQAIPVCNNVALFAESEGLTDLANLVLLPMEHLYNLPLFSRMCLYWSYVLYDAS